MAIAAVVTQSGVFGVAGGTTSAIDTTGSSGIVGGIWWNNGVGNLVLANFTDSKSNTWTKLTEQFQPGPNISAVLYYCANPTVGTSHTFSTTSHFVGIGVLALSGTNTSSFFDLQNGTSAGSGGNIQPGSITPSQNGEVVVSAFGSFNGTSPSMPTGYTQVAANTTSTAEAGGMGYKIQTTAAAENPTWNSTGSNQAVVIASFKAAGTATAVFRRTLSSLGARTGSRQAVA